MALDLICKQIESKIIYLEEIWRIGSLKKKINMVGIVIIDYVLGKKNRGTKH